MSFCLKKYFGDSFYAPRGLAYTPLPFRPFSRLTTQNSGADRWQGAQPERVSGGQGGLFFKKILRDFLRL